ncbi:hypothetical protein YC2023_105200 [Brassica napus]
MNSRPAHDIPGLPHVIERGTPMRKLNSKEMKIGKPTKASASDRDKETSQSRGRTMGITQVLVLFASALLLSSMLFTGVDSTRSNETWHEHAVENPDEVAAMVDMKKFRKLVSCIYVEQSTHMAHL